MNDSSITVKVSSGLLAELAEWSDPVKVRIIKIADEYVMEAQKVDAS